MKKRIVLFITLFVGSAAMAQTGNHGIVLGQNFNLLSFLEQSVPGPFDYSRYLDRAGMGKLTDAPEFCSDTLTCATQFLARAATQDEFKPNMIPYLPTERDFKDFSLNPFDMGQSEVVEVKGVLVHSVSREPVSAIVKMHCSGAAGMIQCLLDQRPQNFRENKSVPYWMSGMMAIINVNSGAPIVMLPEVHPAI